MTIWIAKILTVTVALMHFYFLWLEMFAWTTKAKKVFRNFPADLFEPTKSMAANQGLYNGFLVIGNSLWSSNVAIFFLSCVAVAGVYGGFSVSKKIFYVQALPAILALSLWIFIYFTL
jgi:putative membrane protein